VYICVFFFFLVSGSQVGMVLFPKVLEGLCVYMLVCDSSGSMVCVQLWEISKLSSRALWSSLVKHALPLGWSLPFFPSHFLIMLHSPLRLSLFFVYGQYKRGLPLQ
jgi:hypothetical protein